MDRFIARSDYIDIIRNNQDTIRFFHDLESSGTLTAFLRSQSFRSRESIEKIHKFILYLQDVPAHIQKKNDHYLMDHLQKDKDYLDHILDPINPSIVPDQKQRKVILSDEDYTLVIAGA